MTKSRLEAFSDGVLAIAITLLTLDLPVPHGRELTTHHGLWGALLFHWPEFAAYVLSFTVIGIMWVNHHGLMTRVALVDRPLLFINLLLLLFIAVVPFATRLFAEYLTDGGTDSHVAAAVYAGNFFGCAIGFNLLWRWVVRDERRLHETIDPAAARAQLLRFAVGIFAYVVAFALAFVSAKLTLLVIALVAVYYVVDQLPTGRADDEEPAG